MPLTQSSCMTDAADLDLVLTEHKEKHSGYLVTLPK